MASKERDQRVVQTTKCPQCDAPPGVTCRRTETRTSPVHSARRRLWRANRDAVQQTTEPPPPTDEDL